MKYSYQWSEDGIIEYGEVSKELSLMDINCYHCDKEIIANEWVRVFRNQDGDEYRICNSCYKKSISPCCKP